MPPEPKPCILATRPTRRLKLSLTLDGAADHLFANADGVRTAAHDDELSACLTPPSRWSRSSTRSARARPSPSSSPTSATRSSESSAIRFPTRLEALVENKTAQASARLSRGLSQRQIVPWAGPSSGRFGRAGLPHRPCSRHQVKALVAEGLEVDWQVTLPSYHPTIGRLAGDVT